MMGRNRASEYKLFMVNTAPFDTCFLFSQETLYHLVAVFTSLFVTHQLYYNKLVTELGKKPSEVAEDIGVTATTVRRWIKQYSIHGDDAFPGKGNLE
jgi:hypothetical protein